MSRGFTVIEAAIMIVIGLILIFTGIYVYDKKQQARAKITAEDNRTEEQKQLEERGIKLIGSVNGCQLYRYDAVKYHYFTACPCQGEKP
jgi:uncharacterized membrane protein